MRPVDALIARGLADLAAEGNLFDPDSAIASICRRLSPLPEPEREAPLRTRVTVPVEDCVARLGAADLAEAGRTCAEMRGQHLAERGA